MSLGIVRPTRLQLANQLMRDRHWTEALSAYLKLAEDSPLLREILEGNVSYLLRHAPSGEVAPHQVEDIERIFGVRWKGNAGVPQVPTRHDLRAAGLASIPARETGLRQALETLSVQMDELHIYLNDYPAVPAWLSDWPKVRVYRSQEHGNLGDAGKFFGYHRTTAPWYFTCDDDILYPIDYAERLIGAYSRLGGPVGVHGSLLRYPLVGYYEPNARHVLHFKWKNEVDRRVQVLGTGTMLFDRRQIPELPMFGYPNMADIWIARFMAERGIAMHAVKRPDLWLREAQVPEDSIYAQNVNEKTDQRVIVERQMRHIAEAVKPVKGARPKVLLGIKTFNRLDYLRECVESLVRTVCEDRFEVVVAIADDGSTDGTIEYLDTLNIPFELHVLKHNRTHVGGQFNALLRLGQALATDFYVIADDDLFFRKAGWLSGYFDAARASGFDHLCHFNLPHFAQIRERTKEAAPERRLHRDFPLEAHVSVWRAMGALFTLTPAVIARVGYADEVNYFVRGGWHGDYSARCCRAGFNELERFWDWKDANEYLELQNTREENYRSAIAWDSEEFKRASTPEERQRREAVKRMPDRVRVDAHLAVKGPLIRVDEARSVNPVTVNDVFDKVFVINLDRRPDRMATMHRGLSRCGVVYERFPAVDGTAPEVQDQYRRYMASRPAPDPKARMSSRDFFFGGRTDAQRTAHVEAGLNGPGIRSAGAMAYSLTYRAILRRCIEQGIERVLVLDDDCLFHKNFRSAFATAHAELPATWKIFQLGTMQYDWPLVEDYSQHLYLPHGVLVASHAVGLHADTYAPLLDGISRWTLPFDIGPLQDCARLFDEASFICKPNLIIQDQSESDINSSDVAKSEASKTKNIYRWDPALYE